MLIRGFYYEGWDPTDKPVKKRHSDEFLTRVEQELVSSAIDPEEVARAMFLVVANRISEGEIEDIEHVLPRDTGSVVRKGRTKGDRLAHETAILS